MTRNEYALPHQETTEHLSDFGGKGKGVFCLGKGAVGMDME